MYEDYEEAERIRIEENMQDLTDRCWYVAKGAVIVNSHSGNHFEIIDTLHYEYDGCTKDVYVLKNLEEWNHGKLSLLDTWELDGVWWYIDNHMERKMTKFTF